MESPLISHCLDCLPWWANEYKTCFYAFAGKRRVLAQLRPHQLGFVLHNAYSKTYEAISRMYARAALMLSHFNDTIAI